MTFQWPGLLDILYRLWRLRCLIAVGTVLPVLAFGLMGLIGLGSITSLGALCATLVLCLLVIAGHAVVSPNAHQELLAITLVLCVGAALDPLFSGSFFGWLLFGICAFCLFWGAQGRILGLGSGTKPHL